MPLMPWVIALAALACSSGARAAERLEYRVNGVDVHATYARGPEAAHLIEAAVAAAPVGVDGAPARWSRQAGWRLLASRDGAFSRVLQVRGEGATLEAIRSELDVTRLPRAPAPPPLWLPPSTSLVSAVEVSAPTVSRQWIARSLWTARSLDAWIRLSSRLAGWSASGPRGRAGLVLERGGERVGVTVLPDASAGPTGSVAILTSWGRP